MKLDWVEGFEIRTRLDGASVVISANREGLLSLAEQMTALAHALPGEHIHYDASNSLENGSTELIVEKI